MDMSTVSKFIPTRATLPTTLNTNGYSNGNITQLSIASSPTNTADTSFTQYHLPIYTTVITQCQNKKPTATKNNKATMSNTSATTLLNQNKHAYQLSKRANTVKPLVQKATLWFADSKQKLNANMKIQQQQSFTIHTFFWWQFKAKTHIIPIQTRSNDKVRTCSQSISLTKLFSKISNDTHVIKNKKTTYFPHDLKFEVKV
jgi:hypothetical protein